MTIAGTYAFTVKTPLGDQKGELTVALVGGGEAFTGAISGALGSLPIAGKVDGDSFSWTMKTAMPMPLEVECAATVSGETLTGTARAGVFGSFEMTGSRVG